MSERYRMTVVAAIVVLLCFIGAIIAWLSVAGTQGRTTPAIATIVGLLAPTLVGFLALLRVEKVDQHLTENGQRLDTHEQAITALTNTVEKKVNG